jgi:arylsulfatase A-like enzyme
MIRLNISALLLLVAGLASADGKAARAVAAERSPNVVLFLVDDLGWSDLACYGSRVYETPNVDRLAQEGVRFTQGYAACHVCSPTRAAILTGKYPARLHLTDWLPGRRDFPFQKLKNAAIHQELPLAEVTLAEALNDHGYATGHFGKWHLGEEPYGPLAQGFDVQLPRWNKGWPKVGYHAPFQLDGLADKPGDYLTDRLTDEALKFIDENQSRPFFLYLAHFAVHDPIQGREDLVAKYHARLESLPREGGEAFVLEGNPDDEEPLSRGELDRLLKTDEYKPFRVLPRRTVKIKQRQDNPQFAAMVESMDESLGRVMARLRDLKLDQNTIVIFTSDNGGMSAANFGQPQRVIAADRLDAAFSTSNLPLRGGKGWMYEGGIRVPLIIKWPGASGNGKTCDVPAISTDLYPSVLEIAGLPARPQHHADGVSLAALLKGANELPREAIYWHFPHYSNHGMQSPGGAVRAGDYKLLDYFENGTVQLFNLRDDPGEQRDLKGELPDVAARLKRMLDRWRQSVAAQTMESNPAYRP